MVHTVKANFRFKDQEKKEEFLAILKSSDGLGCTRQFDGCLSIECLCSNEDPNLIVIWQRWESQANHEAYFQYRKDHGLIDKLGEMLAEPLGVERYTSLSV